jgi:hypothetical protein
MTMTRRVPVVLCLWWVLWAAAAAAAPIDLSRTSGPNSYFNRPGADLATHDRELRECLVMAAAAHQPQGAVVSLNVLGAAVEAGLLSAEEKRKTAVAIGANTENCMVVRGWRVVQVAPESALDLAKLNQADLAARLSGWVGAAAPPGTVLRQWSNALADRATVRFRAEAWSGALSLSVQALDRSHDPNLPKPSDYSARTAEDAAVALKAGEIATAPPNQAVVIFRIIGANLRNGSGLALRRDANADGQPTVIYGNVDTGNFKSTQWFVYKVPPGRWRIESFSVARDYFVVNLCLGSPSFDVHAGDVVYAGTFDYAAQHMTPDLSLDPLRQWLGSRGTDRMRPAVYVNGDRGACAGTYIYAYEIDGVGYQPGYEWGGAAAGAH